MRPWNASGRLRGQQSAKETLPESPGTTWKMRHKRTSGRKQRQKTDQTVPLKATQAANDSTLAHFGSKRHSRNVRKFKKPAKRSARRIKNENGTPKRAETIPKTPKGLKSHPEATRNQQIADKKLENTTAMTPKWPSIAVSMGTKSGDTLIVRSPGAGPPMGGPRSALPGHSGSQQIRYTSGMRHELNTLLDGRAKEICAKVL